MKFLVTDVETGGFEGTSLLSVYFGVLDEDFNLLDELEVFVRPKDHIYKVTAEALRINKINLIAHEERAMTYADAGTLLFDFLQKNSNGGTLKLEPLGHNVYFDIVRIKEDLISNGSWLKYVSYRVNDTGGIGSFLKKQGKIPSDISGSLSSYATYFGIDTSRAHDAKGDCEMVIEIFKRMLKL